MISIRDMGYKETEVFGSLLHIDQRLYVIDKIKWSLFD